MVFLSELEAEVINSWMYLKCCDFEDKYAWTASVAPENTITTPPPGRYINCNKQKLVRDESC